MASSSSEAAPGPAETPRSSGTGPTWRQPEFLRVVRSRVQPGQFERFTKIMHEPFYLTGVNLVASATNGTSVRFSVSGSTRSIYTVSLAPNGSCACACKDALMNCRRNGFVCKHVCFVLFRVLQHDSADFFDGLRVTPDQLSAAAARALTANFRPPSSAIAAAAMTRAQVASLCASLDNLMGATVANRASTGPRFDVVTRTAEECPICYDALDIGGNVDIGSMKVLGCPDCGNAVHQRCMERWLSTMTRPSCVWCRSRAWSHYAPSGLDLAH